MLQRFMVKGFRCIHDVDVALTPIHAFVGPNDSGKSTLLRAVEKLCGAIASDSPQHALRGGSPGQMFGLVTADNQRWEWLVEQKATVVKAPDEPPDWARLDEDAGGCTFFHLNPQQLRSEATILTEEKPIAFQDTAGWGLPAVLMAIQQADYTAWGAIRARTLELFPSLQNITVRSSKPGMAAIRAQLADGQLFSADDLSEGLLYYLAFVALRYIKRTAVICIEEPENGLHPARIAEVVKVLREVSREGNVQILMATHSPLVLNELRPSEVSVVTRTPEKGTIVTPLLSIPDFERRSAVYSLGELWIAYCDGNMETELLNPTETQ